MVASSRPSHPARAAAAREVTTSALRPSAPATPQAAATARSRVAGREADAGESDSSDQDLRVTTVRSIRQPVGSLSGGQRQAVAVAKAVMQDVKLVIMDEPTAALGVTQTELVLNLITRLASTGHAVLLISHNLNDVFQVADRIAVLYLGRLVAVGPAAEFDTQSAVELMTTGGSTRPPNGSGSEPTDSRNVSSGSEG